jgi:hypothetical protein
MLRAARSAVFCAIALLLPVAPLLADTLQMVDEPGATEARPARGMTMNRVESRFGSPERRLAAIGDPPITRWEYSGFIVYFEYDKVLHAVATR